MFNIFIKMVPRNFSIVNNSGYVITKNVIEILHPL